MPSIKNVFQDYAPNSGVFDEFLTETGAVRTHAQPFVDAVNRLGKEEFQRRWSRSLRLVHENGFGYSGRVSPGDRPRPWDLDAFPLLIASQEWQAVTIALEQRARLLNLVLQDLYGPQSLIKTGILPPELLFMHPGFLRPYHGQQPPGGSFLQFYSADLSRSPNGEWWVLADRTEAPSGVGYALENRVVISRMLPDVFHQCQVQRLAPFFIAAQETLKSLAPEHRENPRVVILSHGPTSPNYFEDAYLARYLGYTLVEGGDLDVRHGHVMLKTLGGLLPVDVIVRRQNSGDCDPLELGSQSNLGVAGLMEAIRTGKVAIANALGSGLVESVGFMAFMPQLCQVLLGEDLKMPGVATWWCGQPESLNYVLSNLDKLTIHLAFRRRGKDGPAREALTEMPLAKLIETIKANPTQYAAQEKMVRSSAPVWGAKLQPSHVALRTYLVASGDSYQVMQGALARISSSLVPLETSIRKGEGSKDCWVLADAPVEHVSLLGELGHTIELRRSGAELPSRAADNFYWIGRQLERADSYARMLRGAVSRLVGETRSSSNVEIPILLRCLAEQGQIEPGYAVDEMKSQLPPIEEELPHIVFDSSHPASLRNVLDELFRLGSIVRDRMSLDTWRIIHHIDEGFQPPSDTSTDLSDLLARTDELILRLAAFSGIVRESMTRTQAYRFLELGRRLERSFQIVGLVKNFFIPLPEVPGPVFETALEIADSLMTYRTRYLANLHMAAVLDLLLTDETNPRSLAAQFVQLEKHVQLLPRKQVEPGYSAERRLAISLLHSIRMVDIQAVTEVHRLGDIDPLEQLIEFWQSQLPLLAEAISHRYLVHAVPAHQLGEINPE